MNASKCSYPFGCARNADPTVPVGDWGLLCTEHWEKLKPRPAPPLPKNWLKGCQQPVNTEPVTALSLFTFLSRPIPDRCGKEPVRQTIFGPMCDECWTELRKTTREGKNIIGMLQGYPKKARGEQ